MTSNILTLTKEAREPKATGHLLPTTASSMRKLVFVALCCTVLMLFAAPAMADGDLCTNAGAPYPCGITITITGQSGNLTATFGGSGIPYDGDEDQMVGVQNLSGVAVGAIILSAPIISNTPPYSDNLFAFDGDGACTLSGQCNYGPTGYEGPDNTFLGMSPDLTTGKVLFTVALPASVGTTWFSIENTPTAVAAIGENKALTAGSTTVFPFGPFTCTNGEGIVCTETSVADDLQVAPRNSAGGDTLTVTAVPIPAGPLSLDNWGTDFFGIEGPLPVEPPFGQQRFSATNYANLACVPYSDFSSAGNPGCVELELDCPAADSDGCQFVYNATADFNIDKLSLPNGIGGAHFLGQHDGNPAGYNGQCPTTGFNVDIIESYTATVPDPITGGGRGNSCFVTAFDPTATVVPPGTTVSNFFGFEFPVSDTKVNPIFVPLPVPLSWDYHDSSGNPINNLTLCKNSSGTGCTAPWVYLSLTALTQTTACQTVASSSSPLPSLFNSGLLNFGKGEYSFVWNTATKVKGLSGCQVSVALQFDSGLVVAPAVFQYH
jgi:hypothetical protein